MNIYLIHGDNYLSSYGRLQTYTQKAKEKNFEIIILESRTDNILNVLRTNNLFDLKRMVVIKNYQLINDHVLKYLKEIDYDLQLVIYHEGKIPSLFINKLPSVIKNDIYELSKSLWKFVENFYPGNVVSCLTYFHETLKHDPVEMVFSILSGQLRDIFLVIHSQTLPYPAWRIQKIKHVSEKYGKNKINNVIKELSEIDIKVKTSNANLKDELDLFIVRKLK